jgi:hypothetical protein
MRKSFILLTMTVCALNVSAQTYLEHLQTRETGKGHVTVVQSAEIDRLVNGETANGTAAKKKSAASEKTTKHNAGHETTQHKSAHEENAGTEAASTAAGTHSARGIRHVTGYRVQVFAGGNSRTDKNKAEAIGSQIKSYFPEHQVYVHFYSPRWICRMGNFRTREEAEEMLRKVREAGYRQASLVKGKITVGY